ncbi:NrfD/PsrC family molybdoenzyme membrane anchor subunit [Chloroflexota bacterium]
MNVIQDTQKVMGWRVAASLFLIATGMGSYLIGFAYRFTSLPMGGIPAVAVVIAAPLVLTGALLLLYDMGQKSEFYHTYARSSSSWMSRGAIFLTAFFILNLVHIFIGIWPVNILQFTPAAYLIIGIIASILAILSLIYTAFLLGVVKPIPFWSSRFLIWLFLFSGLSTGAMAIAVVYSIYKITAGSILLESLITLAYFNFFVVIIEALVLTVYLSAINGKAQTSVKVLMKGKLARPFWAGVVVAGIIIPLIIEALKDFVIGGSFTLLVLTLFGGIIGLIGGFMLRYVIVYGGTRTKLNVNGTLVAPPPENYIAKAIESSYQTFQKP